MVTGKHMNHYVKVDINDDTITFEFENWESARNFIDCVPIYAGVTYYKSVKKIETI